MAGFFCGSLMLILKESRSSKLYESFANSSSMRVLLAFGNLTQLQSELRDSETVLRGQALKTVNSERSPFLEGLLLIGTLRFSDLGLWRS